MLFICKVFLDPPKFTALNFACSLLRLSQMRNVTKTETDRVRDSCEDYI